MDRTLINLASLLLGGAGLFTVLTGFNVPEASHSFYGTSPFLIKREAIKDTSDWIFSSVALAALVLQIAAEIMGNRLPERSHGVSLYIGVATLGLPPMYGMVWLLSRLARRLALKKWVPRVLEPQVGIFESAAFIVSHEGIAENEYPHLSEMTEPRKAEARALNYKTAEGRLNQLERLFEVKPAGSMGERVEALRRRIPKTAAALHAPRGKG